MINDVLLGNFLESMWYFSPGRFIINSIYLLSYLVTRCFAKKRNDIKPALSLSELRGSEAENQNLYWASGHSEKMLDAVLLNLVYLINILYVE